MIVDFHTHVFPERIAPRTIEVLKAGIKEQQGAEPPAYTDATLAGLRASMKRNNIDYSVVMPIATKPKQTENINRFAKEITGDGVISFGSLHPAQPDALDIVESIAEKGFLGIKLHPEFQQFYVDSPESIAILKKAEELGLFVTLHAGADVGLPPPVHCTPKHLSHVLQEISGERLIAAHLGGFGMWDDVEKYLVGTPILMDTAAISKYIDRNSYCRIIKNHGADKILFGTDSPWEDPPQTLTLLYSLGLSDYELEKILGGNARRLLGL